MFVAFLEPAEQLQMQVLHRSPLATGVLLWPLAAGGLIMSGTLGALLRTRPLPLLIVAGMALLIGGGRSWRPGWASASRRRSSRRSPRGCDKAPERPTVRSGRQWRIQRPGEANRRRMGGTILAGKLRPVHVCFLYNPA